jgi:hypothetical protein
MKPATSLQAAELSGNQHGGLPGTGVWDTRFYQYFFSTTLHPELQRLNGGSRPASQRRHKIETCAMPGFQLGSVPPGIAGWVCLSSAIEA